MAIDTYVYMYVHMYDLEIRPDLTMDYGVSYLERFGKTTHHVSSAAFDRILFIRSCNKDRHNSLDGFEFQIPPQTSMSAALSV